MTPSSYLIKFDRQLSEILVDIDHDFSSWDDVELTHLYPLKEYLVESRDEFRTAVVEDNVSYKYARIVENIVLSLNSYILWAGKYQDIIRDGDERDEKRLLVAAILFEIIFEWTCWVKGNYHFEGMEIFIPIEEQPITLDKSPWKNRGGVTPEAEGRLTTENFLILTPKVSWPTGSFLFQRITSWRP